MAVDPTAISTHRDHLRRLSADGGPLREGGPNATTSNRDWFRRINGNLIVMPERAELHKKILADYFDARPDVAKDKRALVLAGPPGAGKSTTLARIIPQEKQSTWREVNADHFKEILLHQALRDGSYEGHLMPEEIRSLEQAGERFFPLELASLVHEESSMLAHAARTEAIARGENLIVDTVLSSPHGARVLGAELSDAGYKVDVVDVETTFEISEARIAGRWERGYAKGLSGAPEHVLGGRWVPSAYPRTLFVDGESHSRSWQAAQELTESCGAVMRLRVFISAESVEQSADPVLVKGRTTVGGPLLEGQALAAARLAAHGTRDEPSRTRHSGSRTSAPGHER